jgi:vacuolar-type H+-ATPase subunit D/Vma8
MEQVNPTRMEMIRKRAQIKLAEQGRDLLREKMDALIQEFFRIMESVSESREKLELIADSAHRSLLRLSRIRSLSSLHHLQPNVIFHSTSGGRM